MKKILIIEDDPAILRGLEDYLVAEHYDILTAVRGDIGLKMALEENPDLILLDLMLPVMNGQEICLKLREEKLKTPILMLTSKKEETDKVLGFELGADDYITKPFSIRELHARIKAHLRRSSREKENIDTYTFADIVIDFVRQETTKQSKNIKLSCKEYEILRFFIQHAHEVVSRNMLLDEVWGYETFPTTRTVDNYILNIRKKLEDDPSNPKHFLTLHKAGYKFAPST
jgi:DNA-binding response OmpR family regulator